MFSHFMNTEILEVAEEQSHTVREERQVLKETADDEDMKAGTHFVNFLHLVLSSYLSCHLILHLILYLIRWV